MPRLSIHRGLPWLQQATLTKSSLKSSQANQLIYTYVLVKYNIHTLQPPYLQHCNKSSLSNTLIDAAAIDVHTEFKLQCVTWVSCVESVVIYTNYIADGEPEESKGDFKLWIDPVWGGLRWLAFDRTECSLHSHSTAKYQRYVDFDIIFLNTKTSLLLPKPNGPLRANGTLATNWYPSERISCSA